MQVSPSSKVRGLGVVFDQYLTFHDHISGICKSTHFHLRGIGRIRNLLTFDATAQLIHAFNFYIILWALTVLTGGCCSHSNFEI